MDRLVNNYKAYIEAQLDFLKKSTTDEKTAVKPFVTISRETGAYGVTISKGLCAYLNKKKQNGVRSLDSI